MVRQKGEFQIRWKTDLPYKWAIGKLAVKYFEELKKRKIMGSKCPKCGKMHMPPRGVCADCFVEMTVDDMVELPRTGTLEGFTVVNYPFVDPNTGSMRPFPYGYLICKIDGADTYLMHFCDETDFTKFKIGQRVEVVFCDELPKDHESYRPELKGDIYDIPFVKLVKEG
ncbi:MAG: Zn-ribbon domain-containing OB-fold protein [Candidatus Hermodarchaeota archaeon]